MDGMVLHWIDGGEKRVLEMMVLHYEAHGKTERFQNHSYGGFLNRC
jgi:hypothetical protein